MKRVIITFAVVLSATANVFPQTGNDGYLNAFEAENSVWTYILSERKPYGQGGLRTVIISGDTIVDGKKWKYVTGEFGLDKFLTRTEDQKVYVKKLEPNNPDFQGIEAVAYDFSLETGDAFVIEYWWEEPEITTPPAVNISKVDSIVLNDGKKHKRIWFDGTGSPVIEGLGDPSSTPFRRFAPIPTGDDYTVYPVCCHVDGVLLYMDPMYADCDGTLVANEKIDGLGSPKVKIRVYDGQLTVAPDEGGLFDVEIYDMRGVMLLQRKNSRDEVTVNINDLPQGVYAVRITSATGYSRSEKFIRP
ncbi:MAG: T9SS type A sorting domain-containing protein [Tannerella sp.]|nr:T9SS type A sorting domain-containing protein [Tannerella sp.]